MNVFLSFTFVWIFFYSVTIYYRLSGVCVNETSLTFTHQPQPLSRAPSVSQLKKGLYPALLSLLWPQKHETKGLTFFISAQSYQQSKKDL